MQWTGVLEFVHLFKAFRMAINPAKIAVALLAVVLVYMSGRVFDFVWGPQVVSNEIEDYQQNTPEAYRSMHEAALAARRDNLLETASVLGINAEDTAYCADHPRAAYHKLIALYEAKFHEDVRALANRQPGAFGKTSADFDRESKRLAAAQLLRHVEEVRSASGRGVFEGFQAYEFKQFHALVDNTLAVIRLVPMPSHDMGGLSRNAISSGLAARNPDELWQSDTVVGCLANMTITGPKWLFTTSGPMQWRPDDAGTWRGWTKMVAFRGLYLVSLIVLLAFWLAIAAFSGSMICRMSALEFAGIDPPGLARLSRFATGQFWNFVKAPLMPFVLLLIVALAMAAVGLVGAIPWIGEVLLGIGMILLLGAGFVVMLLLLGILGGFNLFYPTMAAEGSDSFDAMSRSFAYVYARPWRLVFYTVVSLIYGVVTFLFVAFALYLLLAATHMFVGWGTDLLGWREGAYTGLTKLETMWPTPRMNELAGPVNWWAMSWPEYFGALALHCWLFLLLSTLVAFVISFYFSTHSIIYSLLRRSVDGQSLTDVFQEAPAPEPSSEPAPVKPAAPAATATPAETTAAPAPAEPAPASSPTPAPAPETTA